MVKTNLVSYILSIIFFFVAIESVYCSSTQQDMMCSPFSFQKKLEAILEHDDLGEKVCCGFYDYAGNTPFVEVNSQELKVYGTTKVDYKMQTPFVDKSSEKLLICCVEYHYTIDKSKIRAMCEEFLKSGFFTDTFEEERVCAGLARKLARLQYLLDDIIIEKSRDMHYPRGSISIFDWSKGPIPFNFGK